MKEGTLYAVRFKTAYAKLHQVVGEPEIPESDDPIRRLAIAILGVECGDDVAAKAVDQARASVVDWNEMRVSSAEELHNLVGNSIPQGRSRCRQLIVALQSVYDLENAMSLDRLGRIGRREARQYLDSLDGVDEYAAASVVLWSLSGHAVPVNDRLLEWLRAEGLVNPTADRSEVQAFLERHISADRAKETCMVFKSVERAKRPTGRVAKKAKAGGASKTTGKKRVRK